MTEEQFDRMIAHLRALGNCEKEPIEPLRGVCAELAVGLGGRCKLYHVMLHWPESSCEVGIYPVEDDPNEYAQEGAEWDPSTKYGAKRRRLCLWLANNLKIEDVQ